MQIGALWLRNWCAKLTGGGGGSSGGDDPVAHAVARILLTAKTGDEAAANLFDLLGDHAFDAMQEVLENRCALMHHFSLVSHLITCFFYLNCIPHLLAHYNCCNLHG